MLSRPVFFFTLYLLRLRAKASVRIIVKEELRSGKEGLQSLCQIKQAFKFKIQSR